MKTHLYLIPGMSANCKTFQFLDFPKDQFEVHCLEWLIPLSKNESIVDYAKRMSQQITHTSVVLIGVSFGGIIAQEISKIIQAKKTIIISSIKSKYELPKRYRFLKKTRLYKLFPSKKVNQIEALIEKVYGKRVKRPIAKYRTFLSIRNPIYIDWAIYQALHWQQESPIANLIHIHSDGDEIFPIKHINGCIIIKNVPHVMMILKRAKTISTIILDELTNSKTIS